MVVDRLFLVNQLLGFHQSPDLAKAPAGIARIAIITTAINFVLMKNVAPCRDIDTRGMYNTLTSQFQVAK